MEMMAVAGAYSTGGMFVPFVAHVEAWLRNETSHPDPPYRHGIDCPEGRYLGGFLPLFDRYTEKS
jgi:hypothetical protein